ncbi:circumsporozoite protein-like isoform X2 [Homarus americanus]|uniref:circumsporozoite protein-like isoform X2 n=1 Tax=Homarus americanus TaxID=6706 RepID=UPI001C49117B|nr:circumsporozoite protein-like isoform X2 [Homarus americanus]
MMTWSVVLGVSFWVMGLLPMEVGPAYPNNGFVPAMHGSTPDCVKDPRDTFCLQPKKYPKDRIVYLLENKMFDVDSLLMDETRDSYTFEARDSPTQPPMMYDYEPPRQTYDPPRQTYGAPRPTYEPPRSTYGPPRPAAGYLPPRQNYSTTSKPYGPPPPSSKYGPPPPPAPPPTRYYSQPTPTHLYDPPTPTYDNEGPYPRYPKSPAGRGSSYPSRYTPPRPPPKPQPWWMKIMRSSHRRQRRQASPTDLCPYESDFIMPRAALNNKGDWMFLVNVNEVSTEYTQLVESKKCLTNTCSGTCNIPDGFSAICQQQYVQKRLIALDGSGTKLATDTFWFPSCCVCKLRQIGG